MMTFGMTSHTQTHSSTCYHTRGFTYMHYIIGYESLEHNLMLDGPKMPCRKCYRYSPLQRPVMRNLEGPVGESLYCRECDMHRSQRHVGSQEEESTVYIIRELTRPSPQLTLRSQPKKTLARPLSSPLSWHISPHSRSPGHLSRPPLIPPVTYPGSSSPSRYSYPGQAILPQKRPFISSPFMTLPADKP
jgi:hypothetical protein